MEWRSAARRFGIRFAICLLVLGAAYLVIFGLKPTSHNKPTTTPEKIAALRTALDQTYIDDSTLANFKQNNQVSYDTLNDLGSAFRTSTAALQTALQQAPPAVPQKVRQNLSTVIAQEQQAGNTFTTIDNILSQAIQYDPSNDLGSLTITQDDAQIAQRATAAQNGLKKAANTTTSTPLSSGLSIDEGDNTSPLVNQTTQQALLCEANCFGQLAAQATANQAAQAMQSQAKCTKAYPAVRGKAIQNVIQAALPASYQQYIKTAIPSLLQQLNALARSTS